MFLGWKNQYCEKDPTTKCNLQIQCNPYQITNGTFHRTRTKKKITIPMGILFLTNEAGIDNGASSISGAGKTGQMYVK